MESDTRVTVITCAPNFPKGQVFDGYKNKLWQVEYISGIRVIRVWTYMAPNEGVVRRTFDYLSFMVSAVFASLFVRKIDLVVGTSPQFFTVCAAYVVARLKRLPWIFELRDMWPASISSVGALRSKSVGRLLTQIEEFLYSRASAIVPVTDSFKDNLVSRGIAPHKIFVVTNGVDADFFSGDIACSNISEQFRLHEKFVVGYLGTIGMAHGLETLVEAAAKMQQSEGFEAVHFLIIGEGAQKNELRQKINEKKLQNISVCSGIAKREVPAHLALMDVGVVHLKKSEVFDSVIPSKIFEYMTMGIPILHCVPGESAKIVVEGEAGLFVAPEDPEDLVCAIKKIYLDCELRHALGAKGVVVAQKYDRRKLASKMLRVCSEIALRH